ncbi:MAG: hypothetical protein GKR87_13600 [Kiritimatiellae bacterium]|nr:hypothetical protein [Kiritimatiellia bacterium]
MKLNKYEKYILLEQSGELSSRKQRKLAQHLATSAAAKTYRYELDRITSILQKMPLSRDVKQETIDHILVATQKQAPEKKSVMALWKPALAYAALLSFLFISFGLIQKNNGPHPIAQNIEGAIPSTHTVWDDTLDEQINEWSDTLAMMVIEEWEEQNVSEINDQDENEMAQELLELEGLEI